MNFSRKRETQSRAFSIVGKTELDTNSYTDEVDKQLNEL